MEVTMNKRTLFLIPLLLCSLLTGCSLFHHNISLAILQSSPEIITLGHRQYVLETSLTRNFQPVNPPEGRPLVAFIYVTATDSLEFPSTLNTDHIWIVYGSEVWETDFSEDPEPPHSINQLAKAARNGPKWGPEIYVDVIVSIIDDRGQRHLLKASHQWIGAVW